MSKSEFNSYLMKAILHILKQFFRQKHRSDCKKTWRRCKINFK